MRKNIAATALDDAFYEEIAVQSIVDVQSYRIAAHIASKFLCWSTSDFFYSLNVPIDRPETAERSDAVKGPSRNGFWTPSLSRRDLLQHPWV